MTLIYVAVGGAVGSMLRYLVGAAMTKCCGAAFPYGTLTVNIIGSLAMGALVGWLLRHPEAHPMLHPLLAVGVLGGFTTFSAFSLEVVQMMQRGELMMIGVYLFASIAGSITALIAGMTLTKALCV